MKETVKTSEMSNSSRWSGDAIGITKDCKGCKYKRKVIDDRAGKCTPEDACIWGTAWKRLSPVDNSRRCTKLKKERPHSHCMSALIN